jgi:hypothetical protein
LPKRRGVEMHTSLYISFHPWLLMIAGLWSAQSFLYTTRAVATSNAA